MSLTELDKNLKVYSEESKQFVDETTNSIIPEHSDLQKKKQRKKNLQVKHWNQLKQDVKVRAEEEVYLIAKNVKKEIKVVPIRTTNSNDKNF